MSLDFIVVFSLFFFFNDTATTEIYTLSLHDALPISRRATRSAARPARWRSEVRRRAGAANPPSRRARSASWLVVRSEEHTSELQSPDHLVCRLLLEKKKINARTAQSTSFAVSQYDVN